MNLKTIKKDIIKYAEILDKKNYSPGTSGNISVKFDNKIIITASGSSNGSLTSEDLVLIDFEGNLVEGNKKPSSEKMLHIGIYNKNPNIKAIIHVHSPFLSSFASARKALDEPIMAENVYYFGKIPLAEYALPSSMKLVENTAKYFDKYNAVLMANHGFVAGDIDIAQTYLKVELAETYAQTVLNTYVLGGPVLLTPKEIAEIEALKD